MYNKQAFSKGNQNILRKKQPHEISAPTEERKRFGQIRKKIDERQFDRELNDSLKEVWDD